MDVAIGLEIHVQLATRSKLFCGCSADYFEAPPNSLTCPVCLAHPGTLPVLNRRAIELALRVALALGGRVPSVVAFDRKNYFYPDLPKGYQITQHERPLARGGSFSFVGPQGPTSVRIAQMHLEEDAGKLIHAHELTLVDLNRAGVPLVEIVTEPGLRSPQEARACVQGLRTLLGHLGVSSGEMEKGALRCDANLSLRTPGGALGTKTEIKNMNSTRAVERALAAEAARQQACVARGEQVRSATYGWDEDRAAVVLQRHKEEAHDYRYLPEPDLPPLAITQALLARVRGDIPELPQARLARWARDLGVTGDEAEALIADPERAAYFEAVAAACTDPREAAHWTLSEILRYWSDAAPPLPPAALARLIEAVHCGDITRATAKQILQDVVTSGADLDACLSATDRRQLRDEAALGQLAQDVLTAHPQAAADYHAGRTQAMGFLVGQGMQRSAGRADARRLRELLQQLLADAPPPSP